MKTKEKIDELSEEFLTFHQEGSKVYHIKIREAIAFAYTQCQQDMAKELEMHILLNEHDWSRNPQAQLKDFIEQLNNIGTKDDDLNFLGQITI
jgi:hypothetical protein